MINVIVRVQRGKGQPTKGRRKEMFRAHILPEQARPFDVIVAVKISAAYCRCRILQVPKHQDNRDSARGQVGCSHGRFGLNPVLEAVRARGLNNRWRRFDFFHGQKEECRKQSNKSIAFLKLK